MTALVWSSLDARYEQGLDRGVFYPTSGPGVPWNGLISVEESLIGGTTTPLHYDGIKYMDATSAREYKAALSAFRTPPGFGPCIGEQSVTPGFIITRQPKERFGMSYRVMVGDNLGYKLHLVYNITATPESRPRTTLMAEGTPDVRSWSLEAVPVFVNGYRPTAHFVIDSLGTDPDALEAIEQLLYGTETTAPELPAISDIYDYAAFFMPFGVTEDADGVTDLVVGGDDLTGTSIPGVLLPLPETDLTETETDGLYTLEE